MGDHLPMLDLETLLLMEFCVTALQAIAWLLVWMSWRHLFQLKFIAAGFVGIALGLLLLLLRGPDPVPWRIVTDNLVLKIGVVLLADGMARFLGRPSYLKIGILFLSAYIAFWTWAVAVAPADIALRIHASTALTVVIMSMMIRDLFLDRTQPPILRWITIAFLVEYSGASLIQSALAIWYPETVTSAPILSDINAWYFFQGILFIMGFFICLLFMVGMRLSMDLRDRNAALASEIAERQRLQGELCASLESEKVAREEQRQLMRMVSHEFRTPLAAIRYARDMLEAVLERPQEAVTKRLQAINEAVSRMTMLIDRFLTSERQGDGILKIDELDNVALARSVQQHFDRVGQGNRLHFTTVEDLPGYWADFEMLTTVLINLVDNALKYSGENSPVDIALFRRQNLFIMEVSDRGIGVPEEERSHLGRRFFRASEHGTDGRKRAGTSYLPATGRLSRRNARYSSAHRWRYSRHSTPALARDHGVQRQGCRKGG